MASALNAGTLSDGLEGELVLVSAGLLMVCRFRVARPI